MLIIEPDEIGCRLWYKDRMQMLRGHYRECVSKIINFTTFEDVNGKRVQCDTILLDDVGLGKSFVDVLVKEGIRFIKVKHEKFIL